jgi:3' terminal RNA ribose 2'-O-methyltransferase Hen1
VFLTITASTGGSDLGYLLHKNPSKLHSFDLAFGKAHVFYLQLSENRAQVVHLLDIDPIDLVRGRRDSSGEGALDQYVNDRPYAASSFDSVALAQVFGTAMSGRSKERQQLADQPLDLEATIAAMPCRGGESFLRGLFEPLGYEVHSEHHPLDEHFAEWGPGPYFSVRIRGELRLQELLSHLYVLIPVLDAEKHYWVGRDEVEKLLRKGEGWLAAHPQKEAITSRYLRFDRKLTREALARLADEDAADPDLAESTNSKEEQEIEAPLKLWEMKIGTVMAALSAVGAKSVIDLGCGEGRLLKALLENRSFERIVGMDVSYRSLEVAQKRLRFEQLPPTVRQRIELIHGSLMYRDKRLSGFDAAAVIEVVEHLDPPRLAAFERVVFECAQTAGGGADNSERRIQHKIPDTAGRSIPAQRSSVRVDAPAISRLGDFGCCALSLCCPIRSDRAGRPSRGASDADRSLQQVKLTIPELSLVVMIGPSGCGKSTFARRHFKSTEVLSSDYCRGLVADDENDQSVTGEAFEVLHFIAGKRLSGGRLTVVDATNVQPEARKPLVALARQYHVLPVAIVLNVPERICVDRNRSRPDRNFGPHVVRNQSHDLKRSLRGLEREGFRHVHILNGPEEVDAATIERQPLWNNLRHEHGPFDIVGDVHGCFDELIELFERLGYQVDEDAQAIPPAGRKAIFVGDLVDRGPRISAVLRLAMSMVESGHALCVPGNHDMKLLRKLRGRDVQITHGLADSLRQLEAEPAEFREKVAAFLDGLVSHYVFDDGARQTYYEPVRPFLTHPPAPSLAQLSEQQRNDDLLDMEDVLGKRIIGTRLHRSVTIREENATAALEVMSRFAANPKWLIYLPPTMSPSETSQREGYLEYPDEAFRYFRHEGVSTVVCEQKHMGSRAVVVICRDEDAARRRFGIVEDGFGICYTRTGRRFFTDANLEQSLLARVHRAASSAKLWEELNTDWLCLDCELMPWSAKAQELLRQQYAPTGAAALAALPQAVEALTAAAQTNAELIPLLQKYRERLQLARRYVEAYRRYCWPVQSLDDLRLAPFHLLASEGRVHVDKDHVWHMETLARLCAVDPGLLLATPYRVVDLSDEPSERAATEWWEQLTSGGGEGMVVKPLAFVQRGRRDLAQPAVKCRGREYLRIIYGPEYTREEHLARLRQRGLGAKRSLALREFALGAEALERFVRREPLRRVHECVFGVLALESEPIDPRL